MAIFQNWHFTRFLRAGLAIWAYVEVWRTGEWLLFALGSIFALQAIFDLGCGGARGCGVPAQQKPYQGHTGKKAEDVVFEEIK
jgi:hypothetical protein